jgi:sulfur carrier protein
MSAVRLTVNGEPHEVPEGTTVRGLIEQLDLAGGPVAVEKNGEVVPRAEHATSDRGGALRRRGVTRSPSAPLSRSR